ncbi:hypothetical protein EDD68_103163 [Melghiribacillus thermohalophilus]|uniref:CAAX prenyl protease 2/Lysostaphin resistance protein A-like domain-containing protein n=1 Tax=Melghiribacillus thermohalophilus TaxID=1324956 RepID=A0A4R3N8U7_9BACI|nr:CPBP family intramembrane glutamic endopeptidase [Melghiribacillus thermohalophilus]TCT25608.1 hypothetical protein EDD68_103163 [Melghiribacillus thermohalophilus]
MKKMMNQAEMIKQMSDRELLNQLYLSQIILLVLGILGSFLFFSSLENWLSMFKWNGKEIFLFGAVSGIVFVLVDLFLMKVLPERHMDDGGINERIFKNRSLLHITFLSLLIAFTEELLFRGVIQTTFGYVTGSLLFALVHIRYIVKPVLLLSILLISFYFGYIYEITENLNVTIMAHFTVDFLLGLYIRFRSG